MQFYGQTWCWSVNLVTEKRFQIRHAGSEIQTIKSIYDVLEMTVNQAIEFFNEHGQKKIVKKLLPLQDVGLGYIKLGQASSTLSGGENQRVKTRILFKSGES